MSTKYRILLQSVMIQITQYLCVTLVFVTYSVEARDTIGDYTICLNKWEYRYYGPFNSDDAVDGFDTNEGITSSITINFHGGDKLAEKIFRQSKFISHRDFFTIDVDHLEDKISDSGFSLNRNLSEVVNGVGQYRYMKQRNLDDGTILFEPLIYGKNKRSSSNWIIFEEGYKDDENLYKSEIAWCNIFEAGRSSCRSTQILNERYYVAIGFSAKYIFRSREIRTDVISALENEILKIDTDQCGESI